MARSSTTFQSKYRRRVSAAELVTRAARQLEQSALAECFTASNLASRPTEQQLAVLRGIQDHLIRYVTAGNQCKPAYSQVLMADGSQKPISEVCVGDLVLTFDTKLERLVPSAVVRTWENGPKEVHRYWMTEHTYTDSTPNHEMVGRYGGKYAKRTIEAARSILTPCTLIEGKDTEQTPPNAIELLGYLLGDGCLVWCDESVARSAKLQITSRRPEMMGHLQSLLPHGYLFNAYADNGDYFLVRVGGTKGGNEYISWIRSIGLAGARAADKFIPEFVFTQHYTTRAKFLAGLIATDGWVTPRDIGFCSTSERLARDTQRLLLGLGIYSTLSLAAPTKESHAPLWQVQVRRSNAIRRFHRLVWVPTKEKLTLASPGTRAPSDPDWCGTAPRRSESLGVMEVYDITVDHPDHNYICDGFVTGNSGKTDTAVRELAWLLTGTHPFFIKPFEWGDGPLLALVCGQDRAQLENIWQTRLKPFLNAEDWRENRVSSTLASVTHRTKGHQVIFLVHNNSSENDIKHMQSYSAHWVWVDEMPSNIRVLEELQRRTDAKRGRFLCTFTMKVRRDEIRKTVDSADGVVARRYQLNKLDNPIYASRKQEEMDKIKHLPPELQEAILTGAWLRSSTLVYSIDDAKHVREPLGYNPSWRHLAVVDPATESKLGLTVWAERPITDAKLPGEGAWYCVQADYVEGIYVPTRIIEVVEQKLRGLNIVKRIYDSEASWYANQARHMGYNYQPIPNKSNRKQYFISKFTEALGNTTPGEKCVYLTPWAPKLRAELDSCERNEQTDQIANKSKYHLIDTAHYAVELLPPPSPFAAFSSHADYLIQQDDKRRAQETLEKKRALTAYLKRSRVGARRSWTR